MAEEHEPEIELSPRLEELSEEYAKDPTSRKFLPLAEEYRKSRMYEEAIYICKEGLKHNPGFVQALLTLARCYVELKNYEAAGETLRDALDKNPGNPSAGKMLGELHMKRGEFEQARELFLTVRAARPGDPEVEHYLKQIEQGVDGKPETVDISAEGELHIDKEEYVRRAAYDWVEKEEKEQERDESFGLPEEEQIFTSSPKAAPVDLSGSKREEELDLEVDEGDIEPGLELSLGGEEEAATRRPSLEEEEPVETLDVIREEEVKVGGGDAGAGLEIGEMEEVSESELEVSETESLIKAQSDERILDTELESYESLEVAVEEEPEAGEDHEPVAETVIEAEAEAERTVERQREDFFETDTASLPPLDLTEVGAEAEAISAEEAEPSPEIFEEPDIVAEVDRVEEEASAEPEIIVPEEYVSEEVVEEITAGGTLEVGEEPPQDGIEVLELDELGADELAAFPADDLELERIHIVREGAAPDGVEVGTLEETLKEELKEEHEAEEEMAFELGDDFVLEGVEADLSTGALAPPQAEAEEVAAAPEAEVAEYVDEPEELVEEPAEEPTEEPIAPYTLTSAKIYEDQGHLRDALNIYQKLLDEQPGDAELSEKIDEIRTRLSGDRIFTAARDNLAKVEILSLWLRNVEAFRRRVLGGD